MNTPPPPDRRVPATDDNFNEKDYLRSNPDVAAAVRDRIIRSGTLHFETYGRNEGRKTEHSTYYTPHSRLLRLLKSLLPRPLKNELKNYLLDQNTLIDSVRNRAELQALQSRVDDLETALRQLTSILRHELNAPPPPPKHLQVRVVGSYNPHFIESGFTSVIPTLNRILEPAARDLSHFQSILDFGCGCGRATRALASRLPSCELHGTDIDPEAVDWLNRHYTQFAQFTLAPHAPPTAYPDQKFDLIFGISVMTHLPEDLQFKWLGELARITRPSGYVILTTHGETHYRSLEPDALRIMEQKGFFYTDFGSNYGKSIQLPDFYQTAFHSHAYIQREWSHYFDVIDIQPMAMDQHQDTVLLRKRN